MSERARFLSLCAVKRPGARRLVAHVNQFRHRGLHAKRHLVLLDARVSFRIAQILVGQLVDGIHAVNQLAPRCTAHALRIVEIQHGRTFRPKSHTGVLVGEESTAPQLRSNGLLNWNAESARN